MDQDIAVVGFSFKLPQGRDDVSSLWKTLEEKKNLMTEWPESRLNLDGFYDPERKQPNKVNNFLGLV
jgi:acyl transferase domain-containing protein